MRKTRSAVQVYKTLCQALDARGWKYIDNEDELWVDFGVNGDDVPMQFCIWVDGARRSVHLTSQLPFEMSKEKRIEGAIAVCMASETLAEGSFDYNLSDGAIVFRMTEMISNCKIGEGFFQYMITYACVMVDKYSGKFLALNKGLLEISDFMRE